MIYVVTEREEHFRDIGWTRFADLYEALDYLDGWDSIQADTETTGLKGFINETAFSLQLGTPEIQYVFDMETISWKELKKLLEEKELIGHNLLFDIPFLYKQGIVPSKVFDTFLAETVLTLGLTPYFNRRRSLDGCLERYLGITLDKDLQKTINKGLVSVEAIEYAGSDVVHLHDLKEAMLRLATRRKLVDQIDFENKFLRVLAYIEFSGVKVDLEKLYKYIRRIEAEEFYAEKKLLEYADINWSSPDQVGEYLYEIHGIEHRKEDTGKLQTGEEILTQYTHIPVVNDLLAHRSLTKIVSTYGRKWFHYPQSDGRIHTKYRQMVDTGRTSSGETDKKQVSPWEIHWECEKPYPNLQNVIKDKEFRACFVPEGRNSFAILDYHAQEPVIFADKCRDKNMLDFYQNDGGDFHCFATRLIFRDLKDKTDEEIKEFYPEKRSISKQAYLSTTYLGNGKTIADNLHIPIEDGDFAYEGLITAFPGMKDYFRERFEFALARGFHQTNTVFGGKRFFDNFKEFKELYYDKAYHKKYYAIKEAIELEEEVSEKDRAWFKKETEDKRWYRALKSEMRKESVNTPIQGTAAVMSKLAGIYIFDWIERNKMFGKVLIPLFIHDEYVLEANTRSIDRVAKATQELMQKAGNECLDILKIKVSPIISREWKKE